jgi:hypoxanthine phosphoribosyltransferase
MMKTIRPQGNLSRSVFGQQFPVLLSQDVLQEHCQRMAKEIDEFYRTKVSLENPLIVITLLNGAMMFSSDLMKHITIPVVWDSLSVSSYHGQASTGELTWHMRPRSELSSMHVLLVEDIVDTGVTFTQVIQELKKLSPQSLKICSLLHKPSRTKVPVEISFLGQEIDDHFVVGYGLDLDGLYRQFPEVLIYPQKDS